MMLTDRTGQTWQQERKRKRKRKKEGKGRMEGLGRRKEGVILYWMTAQYQHMHASNMAMSRQTEQ